MDFLRRFCSRSILLPLTSYLLLLFFGIVAIAAPQDNKTQKKPAPKAQPVSAVDDEDIPDSLLHPRWKIQKIAPLLVEDLDSSALDLKMPDNIRQTVEYDDSLNLYLIGSKIGDTYLNAPVIMTPEEYQKWSERRALHDFFRQKDAENVKTEGKDKFSFADIILLNLRLFRNLIDFLQVFRIIVQLPSLLLKYMQEIPFQKYFRILFHSLLFTPRI